MGCTLTVSARKLIASGSASTPHTSVKIRWSVSSDNSPNPLFDGVEHIPEDFMPREGHTLLKISRDPVVRQQSAFSF